MSERFLTCVACAAATRLAWIASGTERGGPSVSRDDVVRCMKVVHFLDSPGSHSSAGSHRPYGSSFAGATTRGRRYGKTYTTRPAEYSFLRFPITIRLPTIRGFNGSRSD